METPRFMRLEDVADELGFSAPATRKLLNSGELRGIKVGGRGIWRVERSEFEAFIQRQYAATQESIEADQRSAEAEPAPDSEELDR